jgi:hypothetical protein
MTHPARRGEGGKRRVAAGVAASTIIAVAFGIVVACSVGRRRDHANEPAFVGESAPGPRPAEGRVDAALEVSHPTPALPPPLPSAPSGKPALHDASDRPLPFAATAATHVDLVTIRLLVEPSKRAHVFWGAKDFGLAPLELRRPRGSGPLDLVLRAPGFLTLHTRVFTDRDNSLSIHLVPEAEASRFPGYQSPEAPAHAKSAAVSSVKRREERPVPRDVN